MVASNDMVTIRELERDLDEKKNLLDVLNDKIDRFDKKMNHEGLTVDEDQEFLKLIFEGMEKEREIKALESKISAGKLLQGWSPRRRI